jgi:hypothetical protein
VNNWSKVSNDEEVNFGGGAEGGARRTGGPGSPDVFADDADEIEDDDNVVGASRGIQRTNVLQREVKNEGTILHNSFLDKLSESNAALKENSLTD